MISRVKILHRRLLQVTHTVSPHTGRRCVEVDVETHVVPLSAIQRVTHKEHALQIYAYPTSLICTYTTHETSASWRDFQTVVDALAGSATPMGPTYDVSRVLSPSIEESLRQENDMMRNAVWTKDEEGTTSATPFKTFG